MPKRQMVGFVGSMLLIVGVFTPIVRLPMVGSLNYFRNGSGDGVIVLILGLISLGLIFLKNFKGLLITGSLSLAVLVFTFINFQLKMGEMRADMENKLAGNPFKGIAEMAVQSVQIEWGWIILIIGALMTIYSGYMKETDEGSSSLSNL